MAKILEFKPKMAEKQVKKPRTVEVALGTFAGTKGEFVEFDSVAVDNRVTHVIFNVFREDIGRTLHYRERIEYCEIN